VAEIIDEMGLREIVIGVPPAGCAVLAYFYFDFDMAESPHGRGTALATGLKRALPDRLVFTYQGDGDIAAIGTAETIHTANRGENITALFINNVCYGMTGGQMAPTTVLGQHTTTSPGGREALRDGYPIRLSEMVALTDGSTYIERTAVTNPATIRKTKKAIAKGFKVQMDGRGFSLIEIVSPCPTNWRMSSLEACQWIEDEIVRSYPLGVIKDETKGGEGC
jgi:2-oxoglutarate ferredoxin oxidoreductase subunit beta